MPTQPKRICTYPGCNTLVLKARCERHPYPASTRRRHNGQPYKTAAWQDARARQLKAHPMCQYQYYCRGAPATEVDHRDNNQANNDASNLVSACKRCHSYKTATQDMTREQGKFNGRHG